jgi:hypothetical protein
LPMRTGLLPVLFTIVSQSNAWHIVST